MSRLKRIAVFVAVLSLPLSLGGCDAGWLFRFFMCVLTRNTSWADGHNHVTETCENEAASLLAFTPQESESEVLAIKGTGAGGYYKNRSPVGEDGAFEVTLGISVDRDSALDPNVTRQYLRVENVTEPQHFVEIEAFPDYTNGYFVNALTEDGPMISYQPFLDTHILMLRIERADDGYHASAAGDDGFFLPLGDAMDPAPGEVMNVRFGASNLNQGARVYFHELVVKADEFGDATLEPLFTGIGGALQSLATAAAAVDDDEFDAAEAELAAAELLLAQAHDDVVAGKEDGTLPNDNFPKLAGQALKKSVKKTKQGAKIAGKLADDGDGKAAMLRKRIKQARQRANVSIGNLAGLKTKNAKTVENHIVVTEG